VTKTETLPSVYVHRCVQEKSPAVYSLLEEAFTSTGFSNWKDDISMIVRPGSNVSAIHGECMKMLIQCMEKAIESESHL